jgi:hypothetical protein
VRPAAEESSPDDRASSPSILGKQARRDESPNDMEYASIRAIPEVWGSAAAQTRIVSAGEF